MGMNAIRRLAEVAVLASLCLVAGGVLNGLAPAALAQEGAGTKQPYTMPEYNSYQACAQDKVPASQVKCFDDFFAKYPNSALLIYAYPITYQPIASSRTGRKSWSLLTSWSNLATRSAPMKSTAPCMRAPTPTICSTPTILPLQKRKWIPARPALRSFRS